MSIAVVGDMLHENSQTPEGRNCKDNSSKKILQESLAPFGLQVDIFFSNTLELLNREHPCQ